MITINPHLYGKMQTDPLKDLAPVASVVSNSWVLSVNPSVPVKNFREFIDYARKASPPLAYASGGNGSIHQMAMEMLKQRAGINLIHVPYKGGAPAATATVAGEVAAMFSGTSSAAQIKAGRLRALAVTGAARSELLPDVPTVSTIVPNFEASQWIGIGAPANTPVAIIERLNGAANASLADARIKARLIELGGTAFPGGPSEFGAFVAAETTKWGKVVKFANLKPD